MKLEAMRVPARSTCVRFAIAGLLAAAVPIHSAAAADLCAGLLTDKLAHPMTALAKPALGQVAIDPQFGTKIRRITAVADGSGDDIIKPVYSTVPAWNADESRLLLYEVKTGNHKLYDGKTYAFIRDLPINWNAPEGVYWSPVDPNVLFYPSGPSLMKYLVSTNTTQTVKTFSLCGGGMVTGGADPMYMSWDGARIGLTCNGQNFIYDIPTDTITGQQTSSLLPPQVAPSGTLAFQTVSWQNGRVLNPQLALQRTLDMANSEEHASLGRLANGHDTHNGVTYDPGPGGTGVGELVVYDMTTGVGTVVVGQSTGYPYPPGGLHISALVFKDPGWVTMSISEGTSGANLLDNELLMIDTNTNRVCRVAHVRTFGKENTKLNEPYWAEAHAVPSPSGTRIVFGSDWGNGSTVDTYVVELPGYQNPGTTPDLAVTLLDGPDPVALGSDVTFTATVSNVGGASATNASLRLTLPPGLAFVSSTPGAPACVVSGNVVTCALGTLAASATSVVSVQASATSGGAFVTQATVSATQTDPSPANNSASQTTSFQPQLRLGDASVAEGQSGSRTLGFTATLTAASSLTVTVPWTTANGSAVAGSDFTAASGTLSVAPGATSQTLQVTVLSDTAAEGDETFYVNLGASANAQLADGQGLGTIVNDDSAPPQVLPTLSVADINVREPHTGTSIMPFTVTLSAPSTKTVTVAYATSNGTATAGSDYVARSGVLSFAPGTTVATIQVTLLADTVSERRETFYMNLSSPWEATILDGRATGYIRVR